MSQQYPLSAQTNYVLLPKSRKRMIFKITLYFTGALISELGLLGGVLSVSPNKDLTNRLGGVTLCIGLAALIGSIIIFFRGRYYIYGLRWFQYFVWILLATVCLIMAFGLEYAFVPNINDKYLPTTILGFIFFLYGIALIWIAHIKAPLRQLINESTRSILESLPAKQISLAELIANLQREFNCSDAALKQIISNLDYIEQMDIPGTSTRLCRIKGSKGIIAFPQVYGIVNNNVQQSVLRAISMLNENEVDLGLFSLSRDFEIVLKAYLIAASEKGKLQIPVKDPPDKWKLVQMIDWARKDGIITDSAVLSYLRQERNNRAHGGMPPLEERQLLLRNVQYLAGLYIDYIKLLDNLTYKF